MRIWSDLAMRVLVTGAHGFIGGVIARQLVQAGGFTVLAGSRSPRSGVDGLEPVRLDVRDKASLLTALRGVDAVVHCAVGDRATTIDGTRNLLEAARDTGVQRLVHLSSISVYGMATGRVDEQTPRVSAFGKDYGAWKTAAEVICETATGIEVVMLRPTIVHGAGSGIWVGKMARRLQSGAIGDLGVLGDGTCNLVHVRDVATAALTSLRGAPGAYNVNGPEAITWNTYFRRLAAAFGLPCPVLTPAGLRLAASLSLPIKAAARALPGIAGRLPSRLLLAPGSAEMPLFALVADYPTDAAAHGLGWAPAVGIAEGLADSAAWLRATRAAA
jgi:nucleoside-diphosphate-sugar epimerase